MPGPWFQAPLPTPVPQGVRARPGPFRVSSSDHDRQKQQRFLALCEPCRADVFRFSLWLARSRSVAEEVVRETFLRAWHSLDSLQVGESARVWLLTIARGEHARLHERKRPPTVNSDDLTAADSPAPDAGADRDVDEVRIVHRAMLSLDDEHRIPLVLQVIMGCSTQEIATELGLSEGAVSTRLFRARNRLRETLGLGRDESKDGDDAAR
jgi:RNA polymerase sigma-70 factor (ECF subfamily)